MKNAVIQKLSNILTTGTENTSYKKAIEKLQVPPENIAAVGDQIFTDIIGANRCKIFPILVEPVNEKDLFITKWKRPIEEKIIKKYLKNK